MIPTTEKIFNGCIFSLAVKELLGLSLQREQYCHCHIVPEYCKMDVDESLEKSSIVLRSLIYEKLELFHF